MQSDDTNALESQTPAKTKPPAHWAARPPVLVAGILAGGLFFCVTNPRGISSPALIAGFVALWVVLYCVCRLTLVATGLYGALTPVYRRGIMMAGTVLPVLLFMLQSIGQLTIRDVLTIGGLYALGLFYVGRVLNAGNV